MNKQSSNSTLGYLLIITSLFLIILGILPSTTLPTDKTVLDGVNDSHWSLVSSLAFILSILVLFVIIGLYMRQAEDFGMFGVFGFVLAVIGSILNICMLFDMAFVWPSLAVHAPRLIDFAGPLFRAPLFSFAHNLIVYLGTIGFLVFGIAMIRARVFPRVSTILFTIGMPLTGVILFPPFVLRSIGSLLAAASFVWIGVLLIRGKAKTV